MSRCSHRQLRPGRRLIPWLICITLLSCVRPCAADALAPGSEAGGCLNMLQPGAMKSCASPSSAATAYPSPASPADLTSTPGSPETALSTPVAAAPATAPETRGGIAEEEIDAFLERYGKPPRSAVRALLDPTDQNIAAMVSEQTRQERVAAYVAQRATALQQAAEPAAAPDSALSAQRLTPYFLGMRVTAYLSAACQECTALLQMLRRFIRDNPIADLRIAVVDEGDAWRPLDLQLQSGLSIPIEKIGTAQALQRGIDVLPAIELLDLRTGHSEWLPTGIDAPALRDRIIALRRTELTRRTQP